MTLTAAPAPTEAPDAAASRPVFGAIDLGTNNCRMLAASASPHGLRVSDAFSRVVRLGEGLGETGLLSDAAMDRAVDALALCAEKFAQADAQAVRAVTTEACRRATNVDVFLDRVRTETGLSLDVVSADDEARLTLAGCAPLLTDAPAHVLLFDIGGGSTEIVWAARSDDGPHTIVETLSLPLGVVTLSERGGEELLALCKAFDAFDDRNAITQSVRNDTVCMLGTSGTVTTLAALQLGLRDYDRTQVDGSHLSRMRIKETGRTVARLTLNERIAIPCIGEARADLMDAGIAILDRVLDRWPAETLLVADRGIREGVILELDAAHDGDTP